ncbi:MAG TPA: M20/M25/M40 family metallo-hydrolase [Methanolinea sp.]|nr:M20/M25/M40 family metallo-hydrolase [Methanolinea sp.]HQK55418.1 M20/M25/M40 family metallo-hydrolase [Methanolinea sp.]
MNVADLCAALVRIRSENPPGDTREIIEFIRDFTDSLGISTRVIRRPEGRDNLVSFPANGRLLFCGHVDVVPVLDDGWTIDPWGGELKEGKVWGRGSTDMKGGCASVLVACREFIDSGRELPADLAFVCDEETSGKHGIQALLASNSLVPCDTIVAEPTPAHSPNIGQKGLMRLCCKFRGVPGHGSLYPAKGVSAVMEAFSLLDFIRGLHGREYSPSDPGLARIITESSEILKELFAMEDTRRVLTHVMYNPGKIEGGEKANIVAQQCSLELDLRIPWGCSLPDLLREIRRHAPRGEISVTNSSDPTITPPDSPLVTRLLGEIERVYSRPARPIVQWAASDARYLRNAGFPVVEYGPGEIRTLHALDEHVTVESLEKASLVYEGMLARYALM